MVVSREGSWTGQARSYDHAEVLLRETSSGTKRSLQRRDTKVTKASVDKNPPSKRVRVQQSSAAATVVATNTRNGQLPEKSAFGSKSKAGKDRDEVREQSTNVESSKEKSPGETMGPPARSMPIRNVPGSQEDGREVNCRTYANNDTSCTIEGFTFHDMVGKMRFFGTHVSDSIGPCRSGTAPKLLCTS